MTAETFKPSPEQRKIIDHRAGHLQVVACAGAGKTEAISRRVSALIEEGVEPASIVAFTFTERAAAGLKNRIARRVAGSKGREFLDRHCYHDALARSEVYERVHCQVQSRGL